jgi:hypothetical protein
MQRVRPHQPSIATLNAELKASGSDLVSKDEILRAFCPARRLHQDRGCGDCIKILDLDGRLQFMSEGGKRVMEAEDFRSVKGCPWSEFWQGNANLDAKRAIASDG